MVLWFIFLPWDKKNLITGKIEKFSFTEIKFYAFFVSEPFGGSKSLKNGGLFPSTFNVATKADVYVNATCGEDGPETFCKPSESARCAVCDARSPDPGKRHNISNVLNPDPTKWWQSPTLAMGERFEYVTIVLDLKQVSLKMILKNGDIFNWLMVTYPIEGHCPIDGRSPFG